MRALGGLCVILRARKQPKAERSDWKMVTIQMHCYSAGCKALQTRARVKCRGFRVSGAGVGNKNTGGSVGAIGTWAIALTERVWGGNAGGGLSSSSTGGAGECQQKFITGKCAVASKKRIGGDDKPNTNLFNFLIESKYLCLIFYMSLNMFNFLYESKYV